MSGRRSGRAPAPPTEPTKLSEMMPQRAALWPLVVLMAPLLTQGCTDEPQTAVAASTPGAAAKAPVRAAAKPVRAAAKPLPPEPDDEVNEAGDHGDTGGESNPSPAARRALTAADIISDDDDDDPAAGPAVAAEGKLLPGKANLPIMRATLVRHLVASRHLDDDDWVLDRVKATLSPTATVGEVNEALEATGARVCELARPQIPFRVTLCLPLQPDRDGVQALADDLKGHRAVVHAEPYRGVPANVKRGRVGR